MNESSPHFSPNLLSRLFKRWAELTYDNPVVFIVLCLALLGLSLSQALHIKMDMSTEAMLHKEDPARLNYDKFRQTFGREDAIILTLATEGLLSKPLLQQIANIHNKIETSVPHVAKVTSLVNARYTYGAEDELIVEDLLEGFPDYRWNDEELTTFVLAQPAYLNRLISADGEYTAIIVELQTFDMLDGQRVLLNEGANAASVAALKDLLADYTHLDLRLSGAPVMLTTLNDITSKSTQFTSFIGSMVVLILSYIFFRRISGVLFPILIVQTSILSALGVMGFFNAPFTLTTNAVLALMLGIAVADAVHILSLFYRYYEDHGDKRLAVVEAMSHSAPAVFLTTLTTAIGFLSFITGDLASTSELGIYAAVAVSFALFYTVTLLPSLIALCPIKRLKQTRKPNRYLTAYLTLCSYLTTTYPRVISLLTIVLLALCLWGASKTDFSYDPVAFFPDRAIEKAHYLTIDEQLAGLTNIEVVIDTGESDGIYNPEFIQKLTLAADTLSNTHIGERSMANSYSLLNILKETHKGLNGNQQAFYSVPESRELIAQEILLFEMSEADDLYDVVNDDKSMVRLSLKTRHADGVDLEILIRQLEQELAKIFANSATVNITGATVLVAESVPRAIKTMAKSFVVAVFLIIIVMIILVKSLRIGLVSIVPNILPILIGLNFMLLMDWPLTMSTIMVGAIAMGIVVDDTLHLLYHFKVNYLRSGDARAAVNETLLSIGPALFITTVVFACCCATNLISEIHSVLMFGACMVVVTFSALIADTLITPAFLVWAYDGKDKKSVANK